MARQTVAATPRFTAQSSYSLATATVRLLVRVERTAAHTSASPPPILQNAGCKLNAELKHYRTTSRLLLTGGGTRRRGAARTECTYIPCALSSLRSLLHFALRTHPPGALSSSTPPHGLLSPAHPP